MSSFKFLTCSQFKHTSSLINTTNLSRLYDFIESSSFLYQFFICSSNLYTISLSNLYPSKSFKVTITPYLIKPTSVDLMKPTSIIYLLYSFPWSLRIWQIVTKTHRVDNIYISWLLPVSYSMIFVFELHSVLTFFHPFKCFLSFWFFKQK